MELAEKEYSKYRVVQDKNFESDFDKEVKRIPKKGKKKKRLFTILFGQKFFTPYICLLSKKLLETN